MQVAEYIDLLQLDVARNKKYRMDAEDWEMVPVVPDCPWVDGLRRTVPVPPDTNFHADASADAEVCTLPP